MNYIIKNIKEIPLEGTHDLPDSRQTLLDTTELSSQYFQAFTKGVLQPNKIWDWHNHSEHYEFFTVLEGIGQIEFEDGKIHEYKKGDIILINPGYKHKITAMGELPSEFFFVRLR